MSTLTRHEPGSAARRAAPLAIRSSSVPDGLPFPQHPRSTDELIAFTLTTLWALATGRTLPSGTPPAELPAHELIAFWSDPALEQEEAS